MLKHRGVVVITAKPNTGKSTLLNTIAKKEVAMVSHKPQATRNLISYKCEDDNSEIIFIDTPGFHIIDTELDKTMNKQIKIAYKKSDIALILIDSKRDFTKEDELILKNINTFKFSHIIIAFTKCEVKEPEKINKLKIEVEKFIKVNKYFEISSLNKRNINTLMDYICSSLDKDEIELENVEEDDNILIVDTIRSVLLNLLKQEIPYSTNVEIVKKNYENNLFDISCNLVVEKESQKPILIGRGGEMIKRIGTESRKKLLEFFDTKINLKLNVVVKKDWKNNVNYVKGLYK